MLLDLLPFEIAIPDSSLLYQGRYDPALVALSLFVAICAAYAALAVAHSASSMAIARERRRWLALGGFCLGIGIWAMHFVGMLALQLPCSSGYQLGLTLVSIIPSVLASTLAMAIISRRDTRIGQIAVGGLLIGAGIGTMHYAGMAAMRLEGVIRYDLKLFLLSIIVAVALATFALWIKFRLQALPVRWQACVPGLSATVMGLAIAGMHYTAMAAAYFIRDGDKTLVDSQIGPAFLASIVLIATAVIIVLTIVATNLTRPNRYSMRKSSWPISLLLAGWLAIAWLSADSYYYYLANSLSRNELQLATRDVEALAGRINESLQILNGAPALLARDAGILRAVRNAGKVDRPGSLGMARPPMESALNDFLASAASQFRADVIWIMNDTGDCIAASNAGHPDSFVGRNYADRDYFRQAKAGYPGRQFAMGRTSRQVGYYYAHPLRHNGRFAGAVVVKRNLASFLPWTKHTDAFISDANGVVVVAADSAQQWRRLSDASVMLLPVDDRYRHYGQEAFAPLEIAPWGDARLSDAVRIGGSEAAFVLASLDMPENGITLHVPRPLNELRQLGSNRNWLFALLAASGSLLIVAAYAVIGYLRATQKAEIDLRIAATAFESHEGMVITDAKCVIQRVNRAFSEMTGYAADEVLGKPISILQSGRHDAAFYAAMWEAIARIGSWQGEVWDRHKTGEVFPKSLTITAVKGPDGDISHYVGTQTDITQRKAAEEEIKQLAFYDQLTGLPNRRLLVDRLQRAVKVSARSGRHGALFFIDLDNFKTLNDTLGHAMGDRLLQQVGERLSACVRGGDTVARLGGDEFVIMLENLSADSVDAAQQAQVVGDKILHALNQSYRFGVYEHRSTPSIGVTLFADQQESIEDLLKWADLAMYQAKAGGRNALRFFEPAMQAAVTARAALEADLQRATESGQFCLYYQVQVDSEGAPTGAEALVRWHHPQRGLVSPAEFIPLAEETGLILPLGRWVLETACAQLVAWAQSPATGGLTLAVNVSARQFRQPEFVNQVLSVLERSQANPNRLKLELTESVLLNDIEDVIDKMSQLKARGVGFSLDDFGTGYSSLAYLKRLPLDQIKIDQSFVRDVLIDHNDAVIARAIVSLTNSLGLSVIAEGVETEAQREFLARNGCLAYQGYLFGKPLPIADFEDCLALTA